MQEKKNVYRITVLLYFALNFAMLTHHESWRDEAQAWTIAKNLNLQEIIDILPTEGHLLPFFLLLKLWRALGGAFAWIGLISLMIMTIAVAMLLYKSPFPIWIKELLVISPIFFYYNAVISRPYSLVVLALVLVASTRREMKSNLLPYCLSVALLAQTHVLVVPLATALYAEMIWYCLSGDIPKRRIVSTTIPLLSLIGVVFELYQREKTAFITFGTMQDSIKTHEVGVILDRLKTIVIKVYGEGRIHNILMILLVVIALMMLFHVIEGVAKKSKVLSSEVIVSGAGILGYLLIVGFVRACDHIQMALVFYMLIVFGAWITKASSKWAIDSKAIKTVVTAVLVFMILLSYKKELLEINYDYFHNFSNSKAFAAKAIDYLPEKSTVLIRQDDGKISAPYVYIDDSRDDVVFWDVDENDEFKCIIWGRQYPYRDLAAFEEKAGGNTYYLTSTKHEEMGSPVVEVEEDNTWDEKYYLYDVTKTKANTTIRSAIME